MVLVTHFMDEAEHLCDRIAIVDRGKIIALDTPAGLVKALDRERRIVFDVEPGIRPVAATVSPAVAFMTIPVATASDREQKLLRRYQVTPMRPIVYFTADVSVYFGVALVGVALLIVAAKLFFGLRFDGN